MLYVLLVKEEAEIAMIEYVLIAVFAGLEFNSPRPPDHGLEPQSRHLLDVCKTAYLDCGKNGFPKLNNLQIKMLKATASRPFTSSESDKTRLFRLSASFVLAAKGLYTEQCVSNLESEFNAGFAYLGSRGKPTAHAHPWLRLGEPHNEWEDLVTRIDLIYERTKNDRALLALMRVPGDGCVQEDLDDLRMKVWKSAPKQVLRVLSNHADAISPFADSLMGAEVCNGLKPKQTPVILKRAENANPKVTKTARQLAKSYKQRWDQYIRETGG